MTGSRLAAGLAVAAMTAPIAAWATTEDTQSWTIVQAAKPLTDRATLTIETQARLSDDVSQPVLRPSIGWKLDSTRTASLGYAYVRVDPDGRRVTHEHRAWQQLVFRIAGDGKGPTLQGRTRLEQRWVEGRDETGWRFRQQVRFTTPVQDRLRAVAWTEAFFGLNQTAWGQRDGLSAWRSFAGLTVPVAKTVTVEPGFLHQRLYRPGEDAVINAAAVYLNLQF